MIKLVTWQNVMKCHLICVQPIIYVMLVVASILYILQRKSQCADLFEFIFCCWNIKNGQCKIKVVSSQRLFSVHWHGSHIPFILATHLCLLVTAHPGVWWADQRLHKTQALHRKTKQVCFLCDQFTVALVLLLKKKRQKKPCLLKPKTKRPHLHGSCHLLHMRKKQAVKYKRYTKKPNHQNALV